ncbi:MAG: sulfotransferase [Saprospiraceae bacterium]
MNTEHKNTHAPFFIVGCQRSGTTLLSVLFEKHPHIYMERKVMAFRLITCFDNLYELLPLNLKHNRKEFIKWLIENDLQGRLKELIDLEHLATYDNVRELIKGSIEKKLKTEGKVIWGDKAPNGQHFINDLLKLIPEAKFIHIIRDGRANAYSMSTRAYQSLALSAQLWVDGNIQALVNQQLIGKEQYKFVHYENLLREPEKEVRAICSFLQIPYNASMLDLEDQQLQKEESYVKSFFDISKIDKWKQQLTDRETRIIENIQGPLLKELGYELAISKEQLSFKYLSVGRRFYLQMKDNFKQLFRSKRTGMVDKELVEINISLLSRIDTFIRVLIQSLFSKAIFRSLYQRIFFANKVFTGVKNETTKNNTHESD